MSIWNLLFDSDYSQRQDIDALQARVQGAALAGASADRDIAGLRRDIARLDLTIEGIVRVLERRGQLTKQELRDIIVEIDLEDGREDGRIGPDRSAKAPKCDACGRPVNPKRDVCVYCNAELPKKTRKGSVRGPYRR